MNKHHIPYHFVPVEPGEGDFASPHPHDAPLDTPDRYSGELRCSLYALTPLFVGNERWEDEKKHGHASPLTIDGTDLLSKHSLKGMIAATHAALSAERMTRVEDGAFLFRPNIAPPSGRAKLHSKKGHLRRGKNGWEIVEARTGKFRKKKSDAEKDGGEVVHVGLGSDKQGILHGAFLRARGESLDRAKRYLGVKRGKKVYEVPSSVVARYDETTRLLVERARKHPTLDLDDKAGKKAARAIERNRALPQQGELFVFFECVENKVHTFGTAFRYPWRYRDTIHLRGGKRRSQLGYAPREEEWFRGRDGELHIHKRLFGTTMESAFAPADLPDHGARYALRGRVSFSHAVYVGGGRREEAGVSLRPLGQPKASSWELYLEHEEGRIATWGTDGAWGDDGGELAGRKFYLHIPQAAAESRLYRDDERTNQNATVYGLRLPDDDGYPHYRFTISFRGLSAIELQSLLAAIDLGNGLAGKDEAEVRERDELWAHKLGLGRPLGLGSVATVIDGVSLLRVHVEGDRIGRPSLREEPAGTFVEERLAGWTWKTRPRRALRAIFRFHVRDPVPAHPTLDSGFHTDVKKDYLKARRLKEGAKRIERALLRPAEGGVHPVEYRTERKGKKGGGGKKRSKRQGGKRR